ncbi:hypothetical protein LTR37_018818 [Vermiconidia calcicola]|uniref:Uncharacterized protein n=1 Tax=Vermiconidia calcicola TaxID=1690605 RepID=A0ACC3MHR4_9PEZI|nr:hypothetical protein LTR37_018818 [Vermiconidia calcicola]
MATSALTTGEMEPTILPKARRILTIGRAKTGHTRSRLLNLPQELLDMIFEFALVEPALWYRRHTPGCALRDQMRGCEQPVWQSYPHPPTFPRPTALSMELYNQSKVKETECRTQHLCQRRTGMALLRTCKQSYLDGSEIFWKENMFCFDSTEEFIAVMEDVPIKARDSIHRLSLLDQGERWGSWRSNKGLESRLWTDLGLMKNLTVLELSTHSLRFDADRLVYLKNIKSVRAVQLEYVCALHDLEMLGHYARVVREVELPKCLLAQHQPSKRRAFGDGCSDCGMELWETGRALDRFFCVVLQRRAPSVVTHALRAVERNLRRDGVPAHSGRDTEDMVVKLPDGTTQEVGLFGLPVMDVRRRKRAWMRERRKQFPNAKKLRTQSIFVEHLKDDGADDERFGVVPASSQKPIREKDEASFRRQQSKTKEKDREEILTEREQRKRATEKEEVKSHKRLAKRAQRSLAKAVGDLQLTKSAGRKRVNR